MAREGLDQVQGITPKEDTLAQDNQVLSDQATRERSAASKPAVGFFEAHCKHDSMGTFPVAKAALGDAQKKYFRRNIWTSVPQLHTRI